MAEEVLAAVAFYALGGMAIGGAIGVVAARSIFHSAMFLVVTLGCVAGVFVILGADFLAAVQVLVYVGAIMVLILFGIMLTPQGDTGTLLDGPLRSPSALLVALAVFVVTVATLAGSEWPRSVAPPVNIPTTESIGRGLFTSYVLPLEIASVLLLIAMIGAIVVARED